MARWSPVGQKVPDRGQPGTRLDSAERRAGGVEIEALGIDEHAVAVEQNRLSRHAVVHTGCRAVGSPFRNIIVGTAGGWLPAGTRPPGDRLPQKHERVVRGSHGIGTRLAGGRATQGVFSCGSELSGGGARHL